MLATPESRAAQADDCGVSEEEAEKEFEKYDTDRDNEVTLVEFLVASGHRLLTK